MAAWWLSRDRRSDRGLPLRPSQVLPAGAVILLFLLLNIEIADFYATGPAIMFRFGVTRLAGPDLHDRLAGLRHGAPRGLHLPAQPRRPRGGARAGRRDDVQVLHVRPALARRPVPRGVARRPGDVAGARRRSRCRNSSWRGRRVAREDRCAHRHRGLAILARGAARAAAAAGSLSLRAPDRHGRTGPRRLAIDVPLLPAPSRPRARVSADFLRLFDRTGRQVPYLLLQSPSRQPQWSTGTLLPLATTEKTSGFEVDFRGANTIDAVRVGGLPAPFLKRLTLEGSGDREHWTLLSGEGTLFDLPEEGLRQTELRFPPGSLPVRAGDVGRHQQRPRADAGRGRGAARRGHLPPPRLTAALPVERRPSEPGRSRYRIKLPAARLPIVAVDLDVGLTVGGGNVFRQASVSESRLSGGDAAARRARPREADPDRPRRRRGRRAAHSHRGALRGGDRSGDRGRQQSAARSDRRHGGVCRAAVDLTSRRRPVRSPRSTAIRWRRGPRYDLEAVRDSIDVRSLKDATWGEPRALAESAPAATPAPIPQTRLRRRRRALHALACDSRWAGRAGGAGARCRRAGAQPRAFGRFADVRMLDASNRQVPYIVERLDEPLLIPLSLQTSDPRLAELRTAQGANRSVYLLKRAVRRPAALARRCSKPPPASSSGRFSLRSSGRPIGAGATAGWTSRVGDVDARGSRRRRAGVDAAGPAGGRHRSVADGGRRGQRPLPITAVRLLLPSYRLRFYRPAGLDPAAGLRAHRSRRAAVRSRAAGAARHGRGSARGHAAAGGARALPARPSSPRWRSGCSCRWRRSCSWGDRPPGPRHESAWKRLQNPSRSG